MPRSSARISRTSKAGVFRHPFVRVLYTRVRDTRRTTTKIPPVSRPATVAVGATGQVPFYIGGGGGGFVVTAGHTEFNASGQSTAFTSDSITPVADSLLIVGVSHKGDPATAGEDYANASLSGGGLTYTDRFSSSIVTYNPPSTQYRSIEKVYTAPVGGSPSSFALSIDAETSENTSDFLSQALSMSVTGHNAANPFVQGKANQVNPGSPGSSSQSISVTLDASPQQGNLIVVWLHVFDDAGSANVATPSGYSALSTNGRAGGHNSYMFYKEAGASESATITFSDLGTLTYYGGVVAVEIAADPGQTLVTYKKIPLPVEVVASSAVSATAVKKSTPTITVSVAATASAQGIRQGVATAHVGATAKATGRSRPIIHAGPSITAAFRDSNSQAGSATTCNLSGFVCQYVEDENTNTDAAKRIVFKTGEIILVALSHFSSTASSGFSASSMTLTGFSFTKIGSMAADQTVGSFKVRDEVWLGVCTSDTVIDFATEVLSFSYTDTTTSTHTIQGQVFVLDGINAIDADHVLSATVANGAKSSALVTGSYMPRRRADHIGVLSRTFDGVTQHVYLWEEVSNTTLSEAAWPFVEGFYWQVAFFDVLDLDGSYYAGIHNQSGSSMTNIIFAITTESNAPWTAIGATATAAGGKFATGSVHASVGATASGSGAQGVVQGTASVHVGTTATATGVRAQPDKVSGGVVVQATGTKITSLSVESTVGATGSATGAHLQPATAVVGATASAIGVRISAVPVVVPVAAVVTVVTGIKFISVGATVTASGIKITPLPVVATGAVSVSVAWAKRFPATAAVGSTASASGTHIGSQPVTAPVAATANFTGAHVKATVTVGSVTVSCVGTKITTMSQATALATVARTTGAHHTPASVAVAATVSATRESQVIEGSARVTAAITVTVVGGKYITGSVNAPVAVCLLIAPPIRLVTVTASVCASASATGIRIVLASSRAAGAVIGTATGAHKQPCSIHVAVTGRCTGNKIASVACSAHSGITVTSTVRKIVTLPVTAPAGVTCPTVPLTLKSFTSRVNVATSTRAFGIKSVSLAVIVSGAVTVIQGAPDTPGRGESSILLPRFDASITLLQGSGVVANSSSSGVGTGSSTGSISRGSSDAQIN